MYNFPYQGKTLQQCIEVLRKAGEKGELSAEVLFWGIESLRNSKADMQAYAEALADICEAAVKADMEAGRSTIAIEQVNSGVPLRKVASALAHDRLRWLINHYNTEEVHTKWNAALPGLQTAGGFASFL